ncbi:hypothetical protein JXO52_08315 [bacterium]|nr:hypothetical protein [bacterium]
MKQCRTFRKMKLRLYYRELEPDTARTLLRHLETCSGCRDEWRQLSLDMELLTERSRPDPGKAFWAGYWDKLAARMQRESRQAGGRKESRLNVGSPVVPVRLIQPVAAVCLLVLGIIIGRHFMPADSSPRSVDGSAGFVLSPQDARQQSVALLGQSKAMLLGFANFDAREGDISTLNVPLQREKSATMLKRASALRQQLRSPEDGRLERLLADLEFILLQIANLEDEDGNTAVEIIRSSVDERSILFKITLQEIKEARQPHDSGPPENSTV